MLNIPELLEIVLISVDDMKTVLLAQRVNKNWYTTIGQSRSLQETLFFRLPEDALHSDRNANRSLRCNTLLLGTPQKHHSGAPLYPLRIPPGGTNNDVYPVYSSAVRMYLLDKKVKPFGDAKQPFLTVPLPSFPDESWGIECPLIFGAHSMATQFPYVNKTLAEFERGVRNQMMLGHVHRALRRRSVKSPLQNCNTLDGIPTEGSWGPAANPADFDAVKAAGFKAVRIPVTWTDHFEADGKTVNATWLQRVSDVVDYALTRNMYAIVNVHHDSWNEFDLTATSDYTSFETLFYSLWLQIGAKLACKSSLLAFEPINEPTGSTAAQFTELNKLNTIFLQALRDSGGFNAKRVVTLVGPGEDSVKTSQTFVRPANITNPWAIQFHYYSPYDLIFGAWGKTTWGSDADKAALDADFAAFRGNFSDVPVVIGEWEANNLIETSARWKYFDYLQTTAKKYSFTTFLWDNSATELDRSIEKFRDPVAIDILMAAVKGKPNAVPDSTTDGSITQVSSAFLYHKVGTNITDQTLTYNFNGNTLSSVNGPDGKALRKGIDYTATGSSVTYKASLLSKYITASSAAGPIASFSLKFSKGAALTAQVVQWDVATLASNSSSATTAAGGDLAIPITWKGINRPAAVQAVLPDGTCLVDTWTVYLPALQQCRTTYGNQWEFDNGHVIIKSGAIQAAIAAAQPVKFTFEFYPRLPCNNATYTLIV
ncbi:hypothetical protein B0A48_11630 [Cryoendolithus antarcticus]|uniref:Glycoside hydrolase family 5 domain-containing protein n=1 Tax=Cryoendolithus antarcticus TaxID=1507870 RepID=A0A1V8SWU5_9PEZI|nr:hypothetical protein B0A48_11630 [Cryoendolithus antarcticus]